MSDLNDIFGYKVYKPPLEELPVVPELNVYGEIVTMIDPSANVIDDPTIQALLETMDGDRTIKIEDLPPDMRYDGWNQRVEYDDRVLKDRKAPGDLKAAEPTVNQRLLPANQQLTAFSLNTARPEVAEELAHQKQVQALKQQEFVAKQQQIFEQQRIEEEKRQAQFLQQQEEIRNQQATLVKQQESQYQQQLILYQIKQQQALMQQKQQLFKNLPSEQQQQKYLAATAENQAVIQKLLLQLAQVNPKLALEVLQQFKPQGGAAAPTAAPASAAAAAAAVPQRQQYAQQKQVQDRGIPYVVAEPKNLKLVHNMGSIVSEEPSEFTAIPSPTIAKPVSVRPNQK